MATTKEQLRRMIERLDEDGAQETLNYVRELLEVDELTEEDQEAFRRGLDDVKAGRVKGLGDLRRELNL